MEIVPFERSFDRGSFTCGKPDLDEWLKAHAGQSEARDTTRTFLAIEDGTIVGYYATKTIELDLNEAASAFGVGKRRYPVPAVLLARLAVHRDRHGRGIGKLLLVDALSRLLEVSRSIGYEVVVVDAIDLDASTFYRRYGFQSFADDDLHLFMTTKTLRATFASV